MRRLRPRVALLIPYWDFWETSAREDLRAAVARTGPDVASALEAVDVVATEVLDGAEESGEVAERVRCCSPEVLLVVQVMAVPPARTADVLDALSELPLVVWAMNRRSSVDRDFDHSNVTTEGATVGTSQLVNVMVRRARPLALQVGQLNDVGTIERVSSSIVLAAAARRLSNATLARVGDHPVGYDCVACDTGALSASLGISVLDISPGELVKRFHGVTAEAAEQIALEVAGGFRLARALNGQHEGLRRSLRFAAALEELDATYGIDAGAINCHLAEIRFAPHVGIAPCFALGRETSRGTPWCCAGDVLTAVAMLTTKLVAGTALYHELERIDYDADEMIIANTGEHDLALAARTEKPELRLNGWFSSDPICGVCACYSVPSGPATLVAFTPHPAERSGFRYVIAEGEFTGRSFPRTGTPNAGFRFLACSARDGYRAWALAGANHHSSCTSGHVGGELADLAAHLGVGVVRVS